MVIWLGICCCCSAYVFDPLVYGKGTQSTTELVSLSQVQRHRPTSLGECTQGACPLYLVSFSSVSLSLVSLSFSGDMQQRGFLIYVMTFQAVNDRRSPSIQKSAVWMQTLYRD